MYLFFFSQYCHQGKWDGICSMLIGRFVAKLVFIMCTRQKNFEPDYETSRQMPEAIEVWIEVSQSLFLCDERRIIYWQNERKCL